MVVVAGKGGGAGVAYSSNYGIRLDINCWLSRVLSWLFVKAALYFRHGKTLRCIINKYPNLRSGCPSFLFFLLRQLRSFQLSPNRTPDGRLNSPQIVCKWIHKGLNHFLGHPEFNSYLGLSALQTYTIF